jgi:hypothetical protein
MADPLPVRSAGLELQTEDGAASTVELARADGGPLGPLHPRAWTVLAAAVPLPATGTTRAAAVLLRVSDFSTLRCPLGEAGPPADASPLACADPAAVGAARVSRLGAVVGQLAAAGTVGVPSGKLSVAVPARALAGELVQVDVTLVAEVRKHFDAQPASCAHAVDTQDDALHDSECSFVFGATADGLEADEVQPELFVREGTELQALHGAVLFPALEPHTEAVRTVWARWAGACTPAEVSVSLACSTTRGAALLETRAMVRPFGCAVEATCADRPFAFRRRWCNLRLSCIRLSPLAGSSTACFPARRRMPCSRWASVRC